MREGRGTFSKESSFSTGRQSVCPFPMLFVMQQRISSSVFSDLSIAMM